MRKMNWFKFVGLSMVIISGGNAVQGVITGSYLFAGGSIAIGLIWIWMIDARGEKGDC